MDYKKLLERYMMFVACEEGITFLDRIPEDIEINFTDEEKTELYDIEKYLELDD